MRSFTKECKWLRIQRQKKVVVVLGNGTEKSGGARNNDITDLGGHCKGKLGQKY